MENIFTIEVDKIRTMKKDIALAEREELNMAQGNLDNQKENVKNQLDLERERATIAELAKKQKELEKKQAPDIEPILPVPEKNDSVEEQTISSEELSLPAPPEEQIKILITDSDSEKEIALLPTVINEEQEEIVPIPEPPKDTINEDITNIDNLQETAETDISPVDENQIDIGEITGLNLEENEPIVSEEEVKEPLLEDLGEIELQSPEQIEQLEPNEISSKELPETIEQNIETNPEEEISLLEDEEEDTGLDLNSLTGNEFFEPELKNKKEAKADKDDLSQESISLNNLPIEQMDLPIEEPSSTEPEFITSVFETKKIETPEDKLRKINDLIFEVEQNLLQISEEKIPFEERQKDIEREMDKAKQRLDLIAERKKRIDELKRNTEEKEKSDQSIEEKRGTEKERWKIEDERNAVEEEKNKKEDEIKSLRLQLKECDFNFEKVLSREKELNMELSLLKRDHRHLILEQEKQGILSELEKLEIEANNIKDIMTDNTAEKESIEKRLANIMTEEKSVEEEIKVIEKRSDMSVPDAELRRMEELRKAAEEKRRQIEEKRWLTEDDLEKAEQLRSELREKYQSFSSKVNALKSKISEINEKLSKKD
ncbi:MAG: hypothetical protein WC303_01990 [Candidatus Paceibacterota bacterium]|jgi:hypothetical protein